jgi:hypothetical protein
MSRWTCPECGGGFPTPAFDAERSANVCPWCEEEVSTVVGVPSEQAGDDSPAVEGWSA